jgi:kumamolisin
MTKRRNYVVLAGSERRERQDARAIGAVDPNERLQVTLLLRPNTPAEEQKNFIKELSAQPPSQKRHLSRAEFLERRGASPEDVRRAEAFALENGLTVVRTEPAKRAVVLSGTAEQFMKTFEIELKRYQTPEGTFCGRTGPLKIPAELDQIVTAVLGLDDRPQAKPHFRVRKSVRAAAAGVTFTPVQIGELYDFPADATAKGECIALIELGGGFKPSDVQYYFQNELGMSAPKVTAMSVDGAQNSASGDPNGPDGEVMLDIEVAGAVAPDAEIVVYFGPNTDQGFYDAIAAAVHDSQNNPSVISISWGGPESSWTQQSLTHYDQLFQDAATLGVTICCASGDNGSSDGVTDGLAHVDFPASSPFATACGGTNLEGAGQTITSETVWNELLANEGATGGGVSAFFARPDFQADAGVPPSVNPGAFAGRGVPDVAGDADPVTGYNVYVDGQPSVIGGTSAVAPLWAGLIARINSSLGKRVGYILPQLYATAKNSGEFRDVISGNNGAYSAKPGWDACTGWGSPRGAAIVSALSKMA